MIILKGAPQVSHQSAKCGSHWYCGGGYILVLVCHVILQDHMTKGLSKFMGESCST